MTRDEIKLVAFVLFALVLGALVMQWRKRDAGIDAPAEAPARPERANPPYIFKDARQAREAAAVTECK